MSEPIRGTVARVLSSREIEITAGSSDGVVVGMYFDVIDPDGEDITDPDTDEVLGSVERPRVRVRITSVQDRNSVASTYRKTGGKTPDSGFLSRVLLSLGWVRKSRTLKTEKQIREELDGVESYVKPGDPVLQVIENI